MYYFTCIWPNSRTIPSQTTFEPLDVETETPNEDNETDAADDDAGGDGEISMDVSESRDRNVTTLTNNPKNPFTTEDWVQRVAKMPRR